MNSAVDVGAASRRGWDGKETVDQVAILEAVAKQRTAEANGGVPLYVNYVPEVGDKTAPRDLLDSHSVGYITATAKNIVKQSRF